MKSFGIAARRRRQQSHPGDGFKRENFILADRAARNLARAYFTQYPPSIYLSEIELWQKLPDGRIAFVVRRLHSLECLL